MLPALRRALGSLLLVGCVAPAGQESSLADDSAIKAGSRFTSPLELGIYDGEAGTLHVAASGARQHVALSYNQGGKHHFCEADLDRSLATGRLTVTDPSSGCSLELGAAGDSIDVRGHVTARLARRPDGALDGTYRSFDEASSFVVRSSTAGVAPKLAYTFTKNGRTFEGEAAASSFGARAYDADFGGCPSQIVLLRSHGAFLFMIWPKEQHLAACDGMEHGTFRPDSGS